MIPSIMFESGGTLVRDAACLPRPPSRIKRLVADFETSSGDPRKTSTNPWYDCTAIGASVTWDDCPDVWFVPRELMMTGWWQDVLSRADEWCNHNVKYDSHVSHNDLGVTATCRHVCTLTGAKIIDSDRLRYGLDVLSRDWLKRDIAEHEWRMAPYLAKSKDYGDVPLDILAEYACVDTAVARDLGRYIDRNMPEESADVWATEQQVTGLLVRMERAGVHVNPQQIQVKQLLVLTEMIQIDEQLERLVGRSFRPHVTDDCYDVLCGQYGLPVLEWTEPTESKPNGGPSFDKYALAKYAVHPDAPHEVVALIQRYRELNTFNSFFLNPYGELQRDGILHGTYNQCIRTARMSCSEPNMMQLSGMAKELIVPPEGYAIVSADWSQIEFRIIVHYIDNPRCISDYNRDPWTDFHQWVADAIPTRRKPAKTVNFMMGYGGGKEKTVSLLSVNTDVVGDVIREIDEAGVREEARQGAISQGCRQRALAVYKKYHQLLPELKPESRRAGTICRQRGYARNWYGRRRTLPPKRAHVAFNTVCQSSAGDMIKERMVALDELVPAFSQRGQVHDNVFGYVPLELVERDDKLLRKICDVMNDVKKPLKVPVRTAIGWSAKNWKDCDAREMKFAD